jgi:hypothetical protein
MAKSKEQQEKAALSAEEAGTTPAPEEGKAPAPEQSEQPGAVEAAPPVPAPEESATPAPENPESTEDPEDHVLYSLEELADAKRVPGWQIAALHKMMSWEPGKRVSETEYTAALVRLKNRRLGG